jgi:hypothetical protein
LGAARASFSISSRLASAGALTRSRSLPFTCTAIWTWSERSSAASASGHGSSHTRRPVISSYTSAPRCGANGNSSEPAVAIDQRSCEVPSAVASSSSRSR